jgi:16S rRNA G1207 methylase RsmC
MFVNMLASEWFPLVPGLVERLQADPPARVADVGCGTGWSSIAIARGFPKAVVTGFDLDNTSIDEARGNAAAGTGTIMRTPTFRRYALDAGFTDVEVLPIENDFWRFYRLS